MKRILKYLTLFVVAFILMPGCTDILDVNDDPTKVKSPSLDVLMPTVEFRTARNHFSVGYTATQIAHQFDSYLGYYQNVRMTSAWSNTYLNVLNNLEVMIDKGIEEGSFHYVGIAKVLKAQNLGVLTDVFEDVPYSQALQGSANTTPTYDKQEFIYQQIFLLLDEAIADLARESFRSPGGDDMIYGGDVDKWTKLAHSLKAKYMLHLSNKNPDWAAIAAEANMGIMDNADNFILGYEDAYPNPWYTNVSIAITTSNLTVAPAKFFVDKMNGLDGGPVDPRLPSMMENTTDTTYFGLVEWDEDATPSNCDLSINTWYGQKTTPMFMFTAAENNFILAEANLHNGGDVEAAFNSGIMAHMNLLGVDAGTFLADVNDGSIGIDDIMKQKSIALYLNGEVWTDMRRHHFDLSIFPGFVVPAESESYLGAPAQRSLYPKSELTRNGDNMPEVKLTDVMWRDQ